MRLRSITNRRRRIETRIPQALRQAAAALKLPCLLLLQPALTYWLLESAAERQSRQPGWIYPLEGLLLFVLALSLLYPVAVSLTAERVRNHPPLMLRAFRYGLYLAAGLGSFVLISQSALLSIGIILAGDGDALPWLLASCVVAGGLAGLTILTTSGIGRRVDAVRVSRAVPIALAQHPVLSECLQRLCASLNVLPPKNVLVGMEPEFFATSETVRCWTGELHGGVLYLPLPTCRLWNPGEFEAVVAVGLAMARKTSGELTLEFRERVAGAVAAAEDMESAKQDWNWFSPQVVHIYLVVLRVIAVALLRLSIVVGAEWFALFVRAFRRVAEESAVGRYREAALAAAAVSEKERYITGLEKEATLSLCSQYTLAREGKPLHRLGDLVLQFGQPFNLRPKTPSPWVNPLIAWEILRQRCAMLGLSMDWCHRLALDLKPDPNAAGLFSDADTLERELLRVEERLYLPEDQRDRERRQALSVLNLSA